MVFVGWGSGVAIFSAGRGRRSNYTIAATYPEFGERFGVCQGICIGRSLPEAEAFSFNYTLILDFFEHDIINLSVV